ncbi:hypothetical protein Mesil_1902 [Allomeiothermus silvanus DSM 9946]|uniref:Uncharacterized protein n=1 Tax=Allomeiothermus silvanus (strain ATCC 700542 / DSM 9946 / NBRC 106475 / NCIMB 13440 / VI-R2) TaxID=526227 RepID=D7BGG1_ALLS1|nr:hypothetical protein [Allomeiothermus silvanus]ADH63777.1 hypothetical protein Mesil_1902 [Allomeiothermus silvanus DSM 9946]
MNNPIYEAIQRELASCPGMNFSIWELLAAFELEATRNNYYRLYYFLRQLEQKGLVGRCPGWAPGGGSPICTD